MRLRLHELLLAVALASTLIALQGCSEETASPTRQNDANVAPADTPVSEPERSDEPRPSGHATTASLQNSFTRKVASTNGAYLVTLRPREDRLLIGEPQAWIATITDAEGKTFTPTELYFDGGMPGHGHGLPSAPRFTRHLGDSDYLLEGMTLNMPGDWQFVVTVGGQSGTERAVFDLNIQPGPLTETSGVNSSGTNKPAQQADAGADWNRAERALIDSLRLDKLKDVSDPSNRFIGNSDAIALGEKLFSDPALSATGKVSCATCHQADKGFGDDKRFSVGSAQSARHTPALLGIGYARWFYWDGRRDSLWAQALTPIETPGEMDNNRTDAVRYIAGHSEYAKAFTALAGDDVTVFRDLDDSDRFPPGASPFGDAKRNWYRMTQADRTSINRAYATLGKVIASYESTLLHKPARFDRWASGEKGATLNVDEQAGLALFLDLPKTQCLRCHNGALFTNQGFHNVATSEIEPGSTDARGGHDFGRMLGLQAVIVDPFNCSGEFSDTTPEGCEHLTFARRQNLDEAIDGAFKVPGLRNLQNTAPYFHDGRFATLAEVVDHYRNQNPEGKNVGRFSEVPDIDITDQQRDQLVAFLNSL